MVKDFFVRIQNLAEDLEEMKVGDSHYFQAGKKRFFITRVKTK